MSLKPGVDSEISERRQAFDRVLGGMLDRIARVLARRWLFALNTVTGALAAIAFVAPVLASLGWLVPARGIYFFYSFMCHQMPSRSYYIFGYQVAQCQRNTAIYASMFLAGLAFAFIRSRLQPLDWRLYGVLIAPMAVDGFSQLFGWRESSWELRTITGALFGAASVWIAYPYVERFLRRPQADPKQRARQVVLFTKEGCSLCVQAKHILDRLSQDYDLAVAEVDIRSDPELMLRYQYLIPVINIDGRPAAVSKVSEVWLRRALDSTPDR